MKRLFLIIFTVIFAFCVYVIFNPPNINITDNWCTNYKLEDNISCGEESLITNIEGKKGFDNFNNGLKHFKDGKWQDAVVSFQKERANNHNNPEILIYLNNAKLMQEKRKIYTIAVALPIRVAKVFLRGVAQVQEEFNKKNPGLGLKVLIVNDENDSQKVAKLVNSLLSKDDVVAVIGHYASEVTKAALPVYQNKEVVVISPGSSAMRETILAGKTYLTNFFFRTVPTVKTVHRILIDKLQLSQLANGEKASVFYNPNSTYSKSAFEEFRQELRVNNISANNIIGIDISSPNFIAKKSLMDVKREGAKALILIPDGHVNSDSFTNALSLINLNRDELPIGGYSVLYDTDILTKIDIDRVKKLVLVISWHRLTSPNKEVIIQAQNLWGTGDISDNTAMSYDATLVLTEALKKLHIDDNLKTQRLKIQQELTQLQVKEGASGTISFDNGDREQEIYEIVKAVSVSARCSQFSAMFVPISYDVSNLPCNRK
ncbi:ABC transporter substrate-binding protein [Cuspidothrix issatschenkoi]|nr:ABC transporter substrate-binding protein [Cuspidothrix issatschenkoi]